MPRVKRGVTARARHKKVIALLAIVVVAKMSIASLNKR